MKSPTLELARSLIALKSVSPEDGGCQAVLIERLAPLGFIPEVFRCGEVTNLWIRRGTAKPLVVLAGHTDVVPPGPLDQWHSDPFVPTIRDGKLHGRGAADMKTSVAAFVVAAERFVAAHPDHPGSLALLITSDEEGPAVDGTVRVVEALRARGERIDFCLVGEPSSARRLGDTVRNGRRGSLSGRLTVKGIQGHIAYPDTARNPVHEAARALADLVDQEWDRGNEFFLPTSFQVSNIHAGTGVLNVIPGILQVDFNFRFSTASTPESLKSRSVAILDAHGLDYEVEWTLGGKPFLTPRARLVNTLTNVIERVTGLTPEVNTAGGTSDGRFIAEICAEVAEFGPVNHTIHKVNEAVLLDEIEPLTEIYRLAIEELFYGAANLPPP